MYRPQGAIPAKLTIRRTDAVLNRIRPLLNDGDVALVAHGHVARVLIVRWLGVDASASRLLGHPHPGMLSFLTTD